MTLTRRGLLASGAAAVSGAWRAVAPADRTVRLGIASYSLRELSLGDVIAAAQQLDTPYVNLKSFHLPYESTRAEIDSVRRNMQRAGLEIVGGGTITLDQDDDDDIRSYFDYAKAAGMPLMVIAPTRKTLPRIEKFAKAYDIAVAIHNHGPEDPHFPGPIDAVRAIDGMDPRVGVCVDVGHTARTGVDVVQAISDCRERLLDIHMKDLADLRIRESQCIVGRGAMPVARIFRQLQSMGYRGYVNLEYEIDAESPLAGMRESFAFMRGVLAGLAE